MSALFDSAVLFYFSFKNEGICYTAGGTIRTILSIHLMLSSSSSVVDLSKEMSFPDPVTPPHPTFSSERCLSRDLLGQHCPLSLNRIRFIASLMFMPLSTLSLSRDFCQFMSVPHYLHKAKVTNTQVLKANTSQVS